MIFVTIPIKCKEDRCEVDMDNRCRFRARDFMGKCHCELFDVDLFDKNGSTKSWTLRCPECLAAEVKGGD